MDKKTIIKKMREGTDVYLKEFAVLDKKENERATLRFRESLKKTPITELEKMVDECSMDESMFPSVSNEKEPVLKIKVDFTYRGIYLLLMMQECVNMVG